MIHLCSLSLSEALSWRNFISVCVSCKHHKSRTPCAPPSNTAPSGRSNANTNTSETDERGEADRFQLQFQQALCLRFEAPTLQGLAEVPDLRILWSLYLQVCHVIIIFKSFYRVVPTVYAVLIVKITFKMIRFKTFVIKRIKEQASLSWLERSCCSLSTLLSRSAILFLTHTARTTCSAAANAVGELRARENVSHSWFARAEKN